MAERKQDVSAETSCLWLTDAALVPGTRGEQGQYHDQQHQGGIHRNPGIVDVIPGRADLPAIGEIAGHVHLE